MRYEMNLVIGDTDHEGHNIVEKIRVESNKDLDCVTQAYDWGETKTGICWPGECLDNNCISPVVLRELFKFFPEFVKTVMFGPDSEFGIDFDPSVHLKRNFPVYPPLLYVQIWIQIAQYGDPGLQIELIAEDKIPYVEIGGYGLFKSPQWNSEN